MTALETERLNLRQWQAANFDPLAAFLTDATATRLLGNGARTREAAWDRFCAAAGAWQLTGRGLFALEAKSANSLLGWCGLWQPIDLDEPELAWSLFPKAQGNGFATEAATRVMRWAALDLHLPPLFSFVHPDNTPSRAVAERLGAEIESETTFRGRPRLVYRHRNLEVEI